MLDLIIRGGQVVTPMGVGDWDVAVQGERIVAVAAAGAMGDEAGRIIDASGKVVVPGGIEPHAHISAPIMGHGNLTTAPPPEVSRAALFGGTTTLMDFAIQYPGIDIPQAIAERTGVWQGNSYADYAHHLMMLGQIPENILGSLHEFVEDGFASVKIFTTNIRPPTTAGEPRMVGTGHLHDLMTEIQRLSAMLLVHAEDDDMVQHMYQKLTREERTEWFNMSEVHSAESEDVSFTRTLRVAEWTGSPIYFVHVSAQQGVRNIAEARANGRPIYGETLHNYCCFNEENYKEENGMKYHTYPSLKSEADRKMLWGRHHQRRPPDHGHRRVLHVLGDEDFRQDHLRHHRRPQRRRSPHGHHVQRRRVEAGNAPAAVRGRDFGQRRQDHGPVAPEGRAGPGERRRHLRDRPRHQEDADHGRLPHLRLQHLGGHRCRGLADNDHPAGQGGS